MRSSATEPVKMDDQRIANLPAGPLGNDPAIDNRMQNQWYNIGPDGGCNILSIVGQDNPLFHMNSRSSTCAKYDTAFSTCIALLLLMKIMLM